MRLLSAVVLCVCAIFASPGQAASPSQLNSLFEAAAAKGEFAGSVLVQDGGAIVLSRGFGSASKDPVRANAPGSPFLIASLSKPITAVMTLRLVETGDLRLEDRLDAIFPGLAGEKIAAVTVSQLLSHTSGVEEVLAKHLTRPLTPDDLKGATLSSPPGQFQYSNSGYVILKLVMEKVTGRRYDALASSLVFEPAGMTQSGILRDSAPPPNLALAYRDVGSQTPLPRAAPLEIFDGPGSIFSTTEDLALFDKALNEGKLLSPASQALMARGPDSSAPWGFGWAKLNWRGQPYLAHQGDFNGYHAVMVRRPEAGRLIVILSNLDSTKVGALRKSVMELLD